MYTVDLPEPDDYGTDPEQWYQFTIVFNETTQTTGTVTVTAGGEIRLETTGDLDLHAVLNTDSVQGLVRTLVSAVKVWTEGDVAVVIEDTMFHLDRGGAKNLIAVLVACREIWENGRQGE